MRSHDQVSVDARLLEEHTRALYDWFRRNDHVITIDGEVVARAVVQRCPALGRPGPAEERDHDADDAAARTRRAFKRLADWRCKGRGGLQSSRTYEGTAWYEIEEIARFELTHPQWRRGYATFRAELGETLPQLGLRGAP